MSSISAITGRGFSVEGLTCERVLLFAWRHKEVLLGCNEELDKVLAFYDFYEDKFTGKSDEEIMKMLSPDKKNYKEALEYFEDIMSGREGLAAIPATVISKETNVRVGYEEDDENEVILFYDCMPWDFNKTEKKLTQDKLDEILIPYMMELGIPSSYLGRYSLVMYC